MNTDKTNIVKIVKFKHTEKTCIDFINKQGNYTNAIKYLIMKEVHENGLRNLSNFIPSELSDEYFEQIKSNHIKYSDNSTNESFQHPNEIDIIDNNKDISKKEDDLKKNNVEIQENRDTELMNDGNDIKVPSCYL